MRTTWIFALGIAALSFSARAEVVKLDNISVDLTLPKDYCPLSRSNPKDAARYDQQDRANGNSNGNQNGNVVLLFSVPCDELAASRAGSALKHWAIWLQLRDKNHPTFDVAGQDHAKIFTDIAGATPSLDLKKISADVSGNLNKKGDPNVNLNKSGVVEQDNDGLYVAITADLSNANSKRVVAGIIAYAVLSERIFTLNIYSDFENSKSFDTLLASAKDVAHQATAASNALKTGR